MPVEVFRVNGTFGGICEPSILRDACVVDQDIDAEGLVPEMLLRCVDDGLAGFLSIGEICTNDGAADVMCTGKSRC